MPHQRRIRRAGVRMIRPEDLTAEWLSARLGTGVEQVEISDIVWGTGTKVLLRLTYSDAVDLPAAVCVKGGFDERVSDDYGFMQAAYATEENFFARIAPSLTAPLPRCIHAADGIVIMEDLRASGGTFGDPLEPWAADRVAAALEAQASWHRSTWAGREPAVEELPGGSTPVRGAAEQMVAEPHWSTMVSSGQAPPIPAELDNPERMLAGYRALWRRDAEGPLALSHADAHVGNTYITADGQPGFLDWQGTCRAPSFYDVAYFISGAMTTDARRAAERELVTHYTQALAAGGGPSIDAETAWLDYRRYLLHCFLWVLTPAVMQPVEKVHAMGSRHAAAIVDHDTLAVLGV